MFWLQPVMRPQERGASPARR